MDARATAYRFRWFGIDDELVLLKILAWASASCCQTPAADMTDLESDLHGCGFGYAAVEVKLEIPRCWVGRVRGRSWFWPRARSYKMAGAAARWGVKRGCRVCSRQ